MVICCNWQRQSDALSREDSRQAHCLDATLVSAVSARCGQNYLSCISKLSVAVIGRDALYGRFPLRQDKSRLAVSPCVSLSAAAGHCMAIIALGRHVALADDPHRPGPLTSAPVKTVGAARAGTSWVTLRARIHGLREGTCECDCGLALPPVSSCSSPR